MDFVGEVIEGDHDVSCKVVGVLVSPPFFLTPVGDSILGCNGMVLFPGDLREGLNTLSNEFVVGLELIPESTISN